MLCHPARAVAFVITKKHGNQCRPKPPESDYPASCVEGTCDPDLLNLMPNLQGNRRLSE